MRPPWSAHGVRKLHVQYLPVHLQLQSLPGLPYWRWPWELLTEHEHHRCGGGGYLEMHWFLALCAWQSLGDRQMEGRHAETLVLEVL